MGWQLYFIRYSGIYGLLLDFSIAKYTIESQPLYTRHTAGYSIKHFRNLALFVCIIKLLGAMSMIGFLAELHTPFINYNV